MPQVVRRPGDTAVTAEINVLPLIDVLLVLLIGCFALQRIRMATDVQLPPPSAGQTISRHQIVLEIRADGGLMLNGHPVPDEAFDRSMAAIYRERPVTLLFIKAAGERPYHEVIRMIDRARGAGIEIVAMVPQLRKAGPDAAPRGRP